LANRGDGKRETIVVQLGLPFNLADTPPAGTHDLLARRSFDQQTQFTVGRAPDSDIRWTACRFSNRHARFMLAAAASRLKTPARPTVCTSTASASAANAACTFGHHPDRSFVLQARESGRRGLRHASKTRIDAIHITKVVANRSGRRQDQNCSTTSASRFSPTNRGPVGAIRRGQIDFDGFDERHAAASSGHVLINNLDLSAISIR